MDGATGSTNISLILFSCGALAYLFTAVAFTLARHKLLTPPAAITAALGFALWQALLAWSSVRSLPATWLIAIETLRPAVLILYLHRALAASAGAGFTRPGLSSSLLLTVGLSAAILVSSLAAGPQSPADGSVMHRAWAGIFTAIGMLVALEQAFRNSGAQFSLLRFACAAIGITVLFDLYLFADTLIFERFDVEQWRARGGINAIAAVTTAIVVLRSRESNVIAVSRNVAFYTTSLTVAGVFLVAVSLSGYAIRVYGGSWGTVLQMMLFFGGLLFVAAIAVSKPTRDRLRVLIAKNFFTLRYDYREEWLRLIAELSRKNSEEDLYVRAIRVLADLYKSPGGLLWLRSDQEFVPAAPCRMSLPADCHERVDSEFCRQLATDWVFELGPRQRQTQPAVPPQWLTAMPELEIVVPLLVEDELIGFVCLQRSLGMQALNWEDLDILKTAARQVASYVARHQASEQISRTRQFDTYNQLTAFIMHDLKNLIAQQELVVKNATKHKENPAFVEDAIDTIQNSVRRMSTLLGKLQQREPTDRRPLVMQDVLIDAIRRCDTLRPTPALRGTDRDIRVVSDRDHLVMIISHIIKNAQEATRDDGFVDVWMRRENGMALVDIEDNGSGMDLDFVRHRLFRPFESTKAGKGMGIGAYQAREFLRGIGGDIRVKSTPGEGTTVTLAIPLAIRPADT